MKGMRDKDELSAEIGEDGAITVENHYGPAAWVPLLARYQLGGRQHPRQGRAPRRRAGALARARHARPPRRRRQAGRVPPHANGARAVARGGDRAAGGGADPLKPSVVLLCDEHLSGPDREKVQARLEAWLAETIAEKLKPLIELAAAEDISGLARGIAFRLTESFGVLKREQIAEELKSLDQTARAQLRKYGVRFGAFNIYFPAAEAGCRRPPARAVVAEARGGERLAQTLRRSRRAPA